MINLKTIVVINALFIVCTFYNNGRFCDPKTEKNCINFAFRNLAMNPKFNDSKSALIRIAFDLGKIKNDVNVDGLMKNNTVRKVTELPLCNVTNE